MYIVNMWKNSCRVILGLLSILILLTSCAGNTYNASESTTETTRRESTENRTTNNFPIDKRTYLKEADTLAKSFKTDEAIQLLTEGYRIIGEPELLTLRKRLINKKQIYTYPNFLQFDEEWIYPAYPFSYNGHSIWRVNSDNGKFDWIELTEGGLSGISTLVVSEGWIYINTDSGIYRRKADNSNELQLVVEFGVDKYKNFTIANEWLYYSYDKSIYRINVDGTNNELISRTGGYGGSDFTVFDDILYFTWDGNGQVMQVSVTGGDIRLLSDHDRRIVDYGNHNDYNPFYSLDGKVGFAQYPNEKVTNCNGTIFYLKDDDENYNDRHHSIYYFLPDTMQSGITYMDEESYIVGLASDNDWVYFFLFSDLLQDEYTSVSIKRLSESNFKDELVFQSLLNKFSPDNESQTYSVTTMYSATTQHDDYLEWMTTTTHTATPAATTAAATTAAPAATTAAATTAATTATAITTKAPETEYKVKAGDTYERIAKRFYGNENAQLYTLILERNGISDASQIYIGQILIIPPNNTTAAATTTEVPEIKYIVKSGDTYERIAKRFYGNENAQLYSLILERNGISDTSQIYIGQILIIPYIP